MISIDPEQAAVGRQEHQEVRGEPADAGLGEHRGERAAALLRRTPGSAPAAAGPRSRASARRIFRYRTSPHRPIWHRARAQTAPAHSGQPRRIRSNFRLPRRGSLEVKPAGSAPDPAARHKPLDFKEFLISGPSPTPRKARGCVTYRSLRCNMAEGRGKSRNRLDFAAAKHRPPADQEPIYPAARSGTFLSVEPENVATVEGSLMPGRVAAKSTSGERTRPKPALPDNPRSGHSAYRARDRIDRPRPLGGAGFLGASELGRRHRLGRLAGLSKVRRTHRRRPLECLGAAFFTILVGLVLFVPVGLAIHQAALEGQTLTQSVAHIREKASPCRSGSPRCRWESTACAGGLPI